MHSCCCAAPAGWLLDHAGCSAIHFCLVYFLHCFDMYFLLKSLTISCLIHAAVRAHAGWLLGHVLADDDHKMRGHILATSRAQAPNDYIFENMCMHETNRFWRVLGIRTIYLVMLIACALIVSGLSTRTRVDLDLTKLNWTEEKLAVDIARAGNAIPAGESSWVGAGMNGSA
eukprot:324424-Pelagomonas_calceolata.AAC.9